MIVFPTKPQEEWLSFLFCFFFPYLSHKTAKSATSEARLLTVGRTSFMRPKREKKQKQGVRMGSNGILLRKWGEESSKRVRLSSDLFSGALRLGVGSWLHCYTVKQRWEACESWGDFVCWCHVLTLDWTVRHLRLHAGTKLNTALRDGATKAILIWM